MAATATPTTDVREDTPDATDAPAGREPTPTAVPARGTNQTSLGGFDDLFVQPVDPQDGHGFVPTLPSGWRHAGLVQLMARQPRERRETILAGGFALAAVLWAPLGVLAFMTRNTLLFGVLSITAVILAVAPRPVTGFEAVAEVADRAGIALDRVGPAIASARGRLAPLAERLRDVGARVVAVMWDVGHRVAGRLRSADRRVSAAVRRGLDGLDSGSGDHNSPSSAR